MSWIQNVTETDAWRGNKGRGSWFTPCCQAEGRNWVNHTRRGLLSSTPLCIRESTMRVKSCWRSSTENHLRSLRRPIHRCSARWVCKNFLQPSRACRAARLLVSMVWQWDSADSLETQMFKFVRVLNRSLLARWGEAVSWQKQSQSADAQAISWHSLLCPLVYFFPISFVFLILLLRKLNLRYFASKAPTSPGIILGLAF